MSTLSTPQHLTTGIVGIWQFLNHAIIAASVALWQAPTRTYYLLEHTGEALSVSAIREIHKSRLRLNMGLGNMLVTPTRAMVPRTAQTRRESLSLYIYLVLCFGVYKTSRWLIKSCSAFFFGRTSPGLHMWMRCYEPRRYVVRGSKGGVAPKALKALAQPPMNPLKKQTLEICVSSSLHL